jgi:hypothetical protein
MDWLHGTGSCSKISAHSAIMGPEVSLLHLKELATGLYPEPAESNNDIYSRFFEVLPTVYGDVFRVEVSRLQFGTLSYSPRACYMSHSIYLPWLIDLSFLGKSTNSKVLHRGKNEVKGTSGYKAWMFTKSYNRVSNHGTTDSVTFSYRKYFSVCVSRNPAAMYTQICIRILPNMDSRSSMYFLQPIPS